MIQNEMKHVAV